MKKIIIFLLALNLLSAPLWLQAQSRKEILPGAYQTEKYISLLLNKRVGIFTNHTAIVNKKHLIDTLLTRGVTIKKIFTPEHGLRGTADAGEATKDDNDPRTGIKIISLYGKKYGPDSTDLADLDVLVFDIQDVGTRFYTYISSLQYFMEAAKENNKPLIILDRPNPNGHFVDGPVLDKAFSSFVGKNSIPIVYGMTIGEYATMLNGEQWLKTNNNVNWSLTVIPCKNYDHLSMYSIDIAPSPNLPDMSSIYWYPTTCLIEGTILSEGRGTPHAFAYIGHPLTTHKEFSFTPVSRVGATQPKLKDLLCYGWDLTKTKAPNHIDLELLISMYKAFPQKDSFFIHTTGNTPRDYYFNKLAGNSILMEQIKMDMSPAAIRASWQKDLTNFKSIRKKYLLYKDFE